MVAPHFTLFASCIARGISGDRAQKKKMRKKGRPDKQTEEWNALQFSGPLFMFLGHLSSGYLGYVQRIRPGESPSVQDFHRGDLIEGYLDYLKVGIKVVLERCTSSEGNFSRLFFLGTMPTQRNATQRNATQCNGVNICAKFIFWEPERKLDVFAGESAQSAHRLCCMFAHKANFTFSEIRAYM